MLEQLTARITVLRADHCVPINLPTFSGSLGFNDCRKGLSVAFNFQFFSFLAESGYKLDDTISDAKIDFSAHPNIKTEPRLKKRPPTRTDGILEGDEQSETVSDADSEVSFCLDYSRWPRGSNAIFINCFGDQRLH